MSEDLIGAYDIRGTKDSGLTVECAWNVGKALADWLPTTGSIVVVSLPAQHEIVTAIIEGLRLQGRNVVDGGNGDKDTVTTYIKTAGLSGGVVVGYDELEKQTTIQLYQEEGRLIDAHSGLRELHDLIEAGNFVPAATKGELTHLV